MKFLSRLLGLIIIVGVFGGMYYLTENKIDKYVFEKTIVSTVDIPKGTKIEAGMIRNIEVDPLAVMPNSIKDAEPLVGLIAEQFIPKGSQLHSEFFNTEVESMGKDEDGNIYRVFAIPNEWIYSYPETLRRGDKIQLFTKAVDRPTIKSEIVCEVEVAYVKDSANREVIDSNTDLRYNGTSKITSIEVIVTDKLINDMLKSYDDGNKFIITWTN